jgi:hypothetical protein
MKKYIELDGCYARDGVYYDGDGFHGVAELEDKIYTCKDEKGNKIDTQYFWGVQDERDDIISFAKGVNPLMFGAISTTKDGRTMEMLEVANHLENEFDPIVYSLKEDKQHEGIFVGDTAIDSTVYDYEAPMFKELANQMNVFRKEKAEIVVREITKTEIENSNVEEFLKDGYIRACLIDWNPEIKQTIKKFEDGRKKYIKACADGLKEQKNI